MNTLTKEWLLRTIAELEEERDAVPGAVNEDAANALAAMKLTLASLEAEPVAVRARWKDEGSGHGNWKYYDIAHRDALMADETREYELIYTAPPAPVAVPDDVMAAIQKVARIRLDLNDFDGDKRGIAESLGEAEEVLIEVVNRRAAMLQGAERVSNRDELPDGWVACSERMPKKNDKVLIFINFNSENVPPSIHDAEFTGATFRRGGATVNVFPLEDGYGVTHWMPLPAAPQQEV